MLCSVLLVSGYMCVWHAKVTWKIFFMTFSTNKQTVNNVQIFSPSTRRASSLKHTIFFMLHIFWFIPLFANINQKESRPTSTFMMKIKPDKERKRKNKTKAHLIWPKGIKEREREWESGEKLVGWDLKNKDQRFLRGALCKEKVWIFFDDVREKKTERY